MTAARALSELLPADEQTPLKVRCHARLMLLGSAAQSSSVTARWVYMRKSLHACSLGDIATLSPALYCAG